MLACPSHALTVIAAYYTHFHELRKRNVIAPNVQIIQRGSALGSGGTVHAESIKYFGARLRGRDRHVDCGHCSSIHSYRVRCATRNGNILDTTVSRSSFRDVSGGEAWRARFADRPRAGSAIARQRLNR